MRVRISVMAGAILALATIGGCGGGGQPTAAPTAAPALAIECGASGSGTTVDIEDFAFSPNPVTVAANGFVTWTNKDGSAHTVSFDGGPDCGTLAAGASQTAKFTVAGTYSYHCSIHSSMKGTVTVQ